MNLRETITVISSASVLPDHPNGRTLEDCLDSVEMVLPDCDIIVMLDGIRPEQEDRRAAYEEFKREIPPRAHLTLKEYPGFRHQAFMTRDTLRNDVKTPLALFIEADWILFPLKPIPVEAIAQTLLEDKANFIRLHQDVEIHPVHEHLMGDLLEINGIPLRQSRAFWYQPHFARVDWYLRMLDQIFSPDCRTFVEDFAYGALYNQPFEESKMLIYQPPGNMKRVTHMDGRKKGPKWDDRLVK